MERERETISGLGGVLIPSHNLHEVKGSKLVTRAPPKPFRSPDLSHFYDQMLRHLLSAVLSGIQAGTFQIVLRTDWSCSHNKANRQLRLGLCNA